jgi:drug/metabolite transporter (DMT)-like permease
MVIGFITSLLLSFFLIRNQIKFNKRIIKHLFVNGIFYVLGFTTFAASIFLGAPLAKAIALNYTYPLAVVILSYLIFKDVPTKKNIFAIFLSLASIVVLMELWTVKNVTQISAGDLFAWLNSFAYAGVIVWGTKIRKELKLNPLIILLGSYLFAIPILILLGVFLTFVNFPLFNPSLKTIFSPLGWLTLLGLGTISSVLPFSLLYFGSSRLKSFTTSLLLLSEVVFVYLAGVLLFGQQMSVWGIIGMIGIIISVLLV